MSKEKKKTIILIVVLSLIALALIVVFTVDTLKKNGTIPNSEQAEIIDGFNKAFNSKERTVIYYASTNCSWCSMLTPILESISEEYDMDYYYVDTSKLAKKQKNDILEKLEMPKHATPTTVVVENGKVIATENGYVEGEEYVEFLKGAGVLPEDAVYGEDKNITFINYDEYSKLIKDKKNHIIVIGSTTCPHCLAIKPALNEVAGNYNITINYLTLDEMEQTDKNNFFKSLETIGYDDEKFLEEGSIGTPLVLMIKNNKVSDYFSGERTISQLVREFTKAGFIKE